MWLGLGFGCEAGPCPWGCHPTPPPVPGCHEGKPCWGDGGGRDGEPMGGMEGVDPVGVVGLLEKPEPVEGKDGD